MRKRIVMFITTLALSTMMLAGCGDKNKTNNSVTSSATEEPDGDATEGPVVNEDDSDYDESDRVDEDGDGVVGDVVDDAADAVDDVVDDTADVVDDATGNQGTDGQANNAGQSAVDDNAATTAPDGKKTSNKNNNKKKNKSNKKLKTKKLIIKRQLTIKADSRLIRKNSYLSKCQ